MRGATPAACRTAVHSGRAARAGRAALVVVGLVLAATAAQAVDVRFQPVADGVYAYIGDKGPRTLGNEGLNASIGWW